MGELYDSKTDLLTSQKHGLVKSYIEYDGFNRMSKIYTGGTDIAHGTPCTLTEYVYDGASVRITKRKESKATWDSAWDI